MTQDAALTSKDQPVPGKPDLTEVERVATLRNILLDRMASGKSRPASFFDALYGDL